METILVRPKNKEGVKLILDLSKQIGAKTKILSEKAFDDTDLLEEMLVARKEGLADKTKVFKKLNIK